MKKITTLQFTKVVAYVTCLKMKSIQFKFKSIVLLLLTSIAFGGCSSDDSEIKNQAPNSFNLIAVADGATNVGLSPQLTWEAATDSDGEAVTYQVYLDTQNPPQTSIANNLGVNSFSVQNALLPETTYYWKVIAKDTNGNTTESNLASFSTRDKTTEEAIIGKWFFESQDGTEVSICEKNSFFLFTEDLFFQLKAYGEDSIGDCIETSNISATYEIIDNNHVKLIGIGSNGESSFLEIQTLTETELVLIGVGASVVTLTKE